MLNATTHHKLSRRNTVSLQFFVEDSTKSLVHHYNYLFHCNFVKKLEILLINVICSPSLLARNTDKHKVFHANSKGNAFHLFFYIFAA